MELLEKPTKLNASILLVRRVKWNSYVSSCLWHWINATDIKGCFSKH